MAVAKEPENAQPQKVVRPWRTARAPEIVGLKEAADILDAHVTTLHRWMTPGSGNDESCHGPDRTYMIPWRRIAATPWWVRSDVERFAVEIGRQRAKTQPEPKGRKPRRK